MAKIEKKCYPEMFQAILDGKKNFDLRLADFQCSEGDTLILIEVDQNKNPTGRKIEKEITYILKTKDINFFLKEDIEEHGFQVLSLR